MKSPNLLFIICDELRWCETGCYGHPYIQTPNIDRLAREGTRFETAVSNCPVCLPARNMMLSGQYPRTSCGSVFNSEMELVKGGSVMPMWPQPGRPVMTDPTLPELLRKGGYHTAAVGKWHIDVWPDLLGFDQYIIPATQHANTAQWFCENGGPIFSPPGYAIDYEADRVAGLLEEQAGKENPLFLYYNLSPPHMPLADAPERILKMYGREDVVLRDNVDLADTKGIIERMIPTYLWDYRHYRDFLPYTMGNPKGLDIVDITALYMGLTTWVDETLGRLLKQLDETGLAESTVVVFSADHGDNLGSHGHMGKGLLTDESIRVPMCWRGPGIAQQTISHSVASLLDIAPTMLELGGGDSAPHFQGESMAAPLRTGEPMTRRGAFIEAPVEGIGVRTPNRLAGVLWEPKPPAVTGSRDVLYNVESDPYQQRNLSGNEMSAEDAKLFEGLLEWNATTPWRGVR